MDAFCTFLVLVTICPFTRADVYEVSPLVHNSGLYLEYLSPVYFQTDEAHFYSTISIVDVYNHCEELTTQANAYRTSLPARYRYPPPTKYFDDLKQVSDRYFLILNTVPMPVNHVSIPEGNFLIIQTKPPTRPTHFFLNSLQRELYLINSLLERERVLFNQTQTSRFMNTTQLNLWEQQFADLIYKLHSVTNKIFTTALDARQGIINPEFIKYDDLRRESQIKHLGEKIKTSPLDLHTPRFQQTGESQIQKEGLQLIINIKFHLYSNTTHELYRIHTILTIHKYLGYATISTNHRYIALKINSSRHAYLSKEEINQCYNTNNTLYCEYPTIMENSSCEAQFAYQQQIDWTECEIKPVASPVQFFNYLDTTNEWIFVMEHSTKVKIFCDQELAALFRIQGTGILRVRSNCYASTSTTTLFPRTKEVTIYTRYDAPSNMTDTNIGVHVFLSQHSTMLTSIMLLMNAILLTVATLMCCFRRAPTKTLQPIIRVDYSTNGVGGTLKRLRNAISSSTPSLPRLPENNSFRPAETIELV